MELERPKKVVQGGGWVLLSLALFILLLAFFIVLNTLTTFQEARFSAVQSSVQQAFAPDIFGETKGAGETDVQEPATDSGSAFNELEEMLKAEIGLIAVQRSADNKTMVISLPEDVVFQSNISRYPNSQTIPGRVADIMTSYNNQDSRSIYTLAVRAFKPKAEISQDAMQQKILGVGTFTRGVLAGGVDEKAVHMGFGGMKPKFVDLVFNTQNRRDVMQPEEAFSYHANPNL